MAECEPSSPCPPSGEECWLWGGGAPLLQSTWGWDTAVWQLQVVMLTARLLSCAWWWGHILLCPFPVPCHGAAAGFTVVIKQYHFRSLETTCEVKSNPALISKCWKEIRGNHLAKVKLCILTFSGLRRSWIQFSFTWNKSNFPFGH